jgi:hypothetical protein
MPRHEPVFRQLLEVSDVEARLPDLEERFLLSIDTLDRAQSLLRRVVFHFQLGQVLGYVQGLLSLWPSADPLLDYALMAGVHRNGFGPASKVLENVNFELARPLTEKAIWRAVSGAVSSLAPLTRAVSRLPRECSEPPDWREEHSELFSRTELTPDELVGLFETCWWFGFPETPAGKTDWGAVTRAARLHPLAPDAVRAIGEVIEGLARDELTPDVQEDLLMRLGTRGNRV